MHTQDFAENIYVPLQDWPTCLYCCHACNRTVTFLQPTLGCGEHTAGC